MAKPVHFDVVALERDLRALHDRAMAKARAGAQTPRDKNLVELQDRLFELLVKSHVTLAEFRNEGQDVYQVAQAFGAVLGNCAGAFAANNPSRPLIIFSHYLNESWGAYVGAARSPDAVGEAAQHHGIVGGNG